MGGVGLMPAGSEARGESRKRGNVSFGFTRLKFASRRPFEVQALDYMYVDILSRNEGLEDYT